ncbi:MULTISPECIES: asparagine synthase-related protein [Cyanophyceae]|uniref:asparagine synthase (glutamine-hydrolyzing) n=1 Tax=Leptolyngbya subtilissima DQ-A4 TaxID=2933933 RepID=A0ABV0JZ15_9CYAN|nr:asparagine synthase-related protein [Nodosilinea sp. FACHB-141]MBD2112404.1 asparagine synthase [Nodosilinea sp. FACHB-141]
MSGILASWNNSDTNAWQAMMADLAEVFGRDGQGDWHDAEAGLSLGRIQRFNTPEAALEPPVFAAEACVLVWDGRLDDRDALLAGRSQVTDAQLIIESYRRWGLNCLKHLIGDYSFILWDIPNQQLVAGCDSVGGRSLAYFWNGQSLSISSRVLSLLWHPQVSRRLDDLYLAHTLCDRWAHPPGLTAFAEIKRLRPGWALVLKEGQLTVKPVAQFPHASELQPMRSQAEAQEKFWHLLHLAIKDRRRSYRPICTTLSGGLDSTTVTVGLLQQVPTIDAFSNITTTFKEFDERQPIQAFLSAYPQVNWHPVNGDSAWPFGSSWSSLPLTDDPLIACTMPMNVQLMQQIQQLGFGTVFDGAWGDELFDANFYDLMAARCFSAAVAQLKQQPHWPNFLWNEWVLPHLAAPLRQRWLQYKDIRQKRSLLYPWFKSDYLQQPDYKTAIQQDHEFKLSSGRSQWMAQLNESTAIVGPNQTYKLYQAFCGVESVSPLGDRRLIDFSIGLHPTLQNDVHYNKIFLRCAVQAHMPEKIVWRHKINHFSPLMYAGVALGKENKFFIDILPELSELAAVINHQKIYEWLLKFQEAYRQKKFKKEFPHREISNIFAILVFSNWLNYIRKYGKP